MIGRQSEIEADCRQITQDRPKKTNAGTEGDGIDSQDEEDYMMDDVAEDDADAIRAKRLARFGPPGTSSASIKRNGKKGRKLRKSSQLR